ncbi:CPBP family intramembrane glutamic endopeptidase [uncultured Tateyamaria sp.]|uniref:CPBP family intramembrane glutamic endopeptidase n=1 Tax=uncultured Tateyamaria sp. TaxID=455651 RepID=UPI002622E5B0|nr:CPBP family intramembrane glutamic endopeptidase [uncultured Tateyamaria sp.]
MSVWSFDYRPHRRFVATAEHSAQVWRLLLGIVLAAAIFLALSRMLISTVFTVLEPGARSTLIADGSSGQTAGGMLLMLFQLGLLAVTAAIVVIMVHKRRPSTLIGPLGLAARQFMAVLAILAILIVVLTILPPYGYGDDSGALERNMGLGRWLLLLPFALIAVLVQTGAEEIFFRGYIQQQLAARFRSPLVWMLLPAFLFGIGHYLPESAGSNAVTIAVWATVFGLLMADLTARSGTLGPAMAVHFVNNISAMVLTSTPDEMSGLALYVLPFGIGDEAAMAAWLPVDFGFMLVMWLAARLAIRA